MSQCTSNGGTTVPECTKCLNNIDTSRYGVYEKTFTLKNKKCIECNNGCKKCDVAGN